MISRSKLKTPKNLIVKFGNSVLNKIFPNKETRRMLLITGFLIFLYRVMASVPIPGIDPEAFEQIFGGSPFNNIFTVISGGRLDQPSLVAIGIAPYINASIIIQLLTTVIPYLEDLQKQGEIGRNKINQYTRMLTVPLAAIQSFMIYTILTNPSISGSGVTDIVRPLQGVDLVAFVITLTAGAILLMWIGELITEHGIGNGASLIIAFGIISSLPSLVLSDISGLSADWQNFISNGNFNFLISDSFQLFYLVIGLLALIVLVIVYVNEAQKKIPIMYARRVRGGNEAENFLPLRLNQAGVMPVIFSQALITFPQIISSFVISLRDSGRIYDFAVKVQQSPFAQFNSKEYVITYAILTIAFAYFYTYVVIKPEEIAKNLQKSGAFIPGIRPGTSTISYLNNLTMRLTFFGGMFLAGIAVAPIVISGAAGGHNLTILSGIGGTSLLIVVGVFMDSYRKMKSLKSFVSYERYT